MFSLNLFDVSLWLDSGYRCLFGMLFNWHGGISESHVTSDDVSASLRMLILITVKVLPISLTVMMAWPTTKK